MPPPSMRESFVLLLACCFGVCIALDTITITQPIQDSEAIVSSGQKFKLGFFSPEKSSDRYAGIMYNLPGTAAVIWVANRERPLDDATGTVAILEDGNLAVLNGAKDILWSTNISSSSANYSAQLLDTGNLVLTEESNGKVLRILQTEQLRPRCDRDPRWRTMSTTGSIQLTSWRSLSDPSVGTFSAGLSPNQLPQLFIWNNGRPYWRSGHLQATFSSGEKGDWTVIWSSQENQCDVYGKCGPYGSCNHRGYPICTCLPGFKPRDQEEWNQGNYWTGGCIRKELLQCQRNESASREDNQYGFAKLTYMKIPDFAEPIAINTEEECREHCLDNCSCTAYAFYIGIGCMQWSGILIDSGQLPFDGTNLYIWVAYSEHNTKRGFKVVIASTLTVAAVLLALSVCLRWKWIAKHKGNSTVLKCCLSF
ncbi:unnamed protein product [Coffea canephora]|uniref:non-specific serine/threonine protein kinase n=1 Tax=Coffea canephora TaxID=49390 RepID=A0A068VAU6_COFCA|nr:unnamed protein product [Coffea canephora]